MTYYVSLIKRISAINTLEDAKHIDDSLPKLYDDGILTSYEYSSLDSKILQKIVKLKKFK